MVKDGLGSSDTKEISGLDEVNNEFTGSGRDDGPRFDIIVRKGLDGTKTIELILDEPDNS